MLRDRLVCGINIDTVQKRLLAESRLTFEDALKIATSMEAATAGAQELMRESQEQLAVHRVGTPMTAASNCYHCGGTDHRSDSCRFKRSICRICGKLGHIQKACRSTSQGKTGHPSRLTCKTVVRQDTPKGIAEGKVNPKLLKA